MTTDTQRPNDDERAQLDLKLRRALLWLTRLAAFTVFVALLLWGRPLFTAILNILAPFLVAAIISYIFNPVVRTLQFRLRMGRAGALLVTFLIIIGVIAFFVSLLLPAIYTQARDAIMAIVNNVPVVAQKFNQWFKLNITPEEVDSIRAMISGGVDGNTNMHTPLMKNGTWIIKAFSTLAQWMSVFVITAAGSTIKFFTFTAFVIMIAIYMLLDYTRLLQNARVVIPIKVNARAIDLIRKIDHALGGYLRGQLIVCVILACVYTGALMLLGLRSYAILIGVLAGFGNLIPYFGPIVGAVPTILWIIFGAYYGTPESKVFATCGVLIFTAILQSIDGWFFQPKIVGKNAELQPLIIILALLVGARFGLIGMILAVPTAIVIRTLLIELWWHPLIERHREAGLPTPPKDNPTTGKK